MRKLSTEVKKMGVNWCYFLINLHITGLLFATNEVVPWWSLERKQAFRSLRLHLKTLFDQNLSHPVKLILEETALANYF